MTKEEREKMEDHEAISRFGFPKHGPHPRLNCGIHVRLCCICNDKYADLHIGEPEKEPVPNELAVVQV